MAKRSLNPAGIQDARNYSGRVVPQISLPPRQSRRGASRAYSWYSKASGPRNCARLTAAGTFRRVCAAKGWPPLCHGGKPCYPLPLRLGLVCRRPITRAWQVPPPPKPPAGKQKAGKRGQLYGGAAAGRLCRAAGWAMWHLLRRRHGGKAAPPPGKFWGFSRPRCSLALRKVPMNLKGGFACAANVKRSENLEKHQNHGGVRPERQREAAILPTELDAPSRPAP